MSWNHQRVYFHPDVLMLISFRAERNMRCEGPDRANTSRFDLVQQKPTAAALCPSVIYRSVHFWSITQPVKQVIGQTCRSLLHIFYCKHVFFCPPWGFLVCVAAKWDPNKEKKWVINLNGNPVNMKNKTNCWESGWGASVKHNMQV